MAHTKKLTTAKVTKEAKVNGLPNNKPISKGKKRPQNGTRSPSPAKKTKVELSTPPIVGGLVLTVGVGDIGQLGLGPDVEEKTKPCIVPDLTNIVAVAAGGLHSLCLSKDGKVYSWGCNDEGALGRITNSEEENFKVGQVALEDKIVQISAGDCHSAALTSGGRVFAWGSFRDNSGPLGFIERGILQKTPKQILSEKSIVKIASGNNHLVLLTQAGQVYTLGCGESGQLGRVAEVFANRNLRNRNGTENLLEPLPIKVYKARKLLLFDDIWAGGFASFVKARVTGDIYGFGLNNYWQLGDEDVNMKFQPVILKSFHGKNWQHISSGQHHSLALDSDGVAYSMGRNEYGRLGLGASHSDATKPTPLSALSGTKVTHVAAGECVSFCVTETGECFGFGMGTNNQLAQGDDDDRWEPVPLKGKQLENKKIVSIQAGGQHTIILAIPK